MYYVFFCLTAWSVIIIFCAVSGKYEGVCLWGRERKEFWAALCLCAPWAAVFRAAARGNGYGISLFVFAIAAGSFAGGMGFACITDIRLKEVYDFSWYPAIAAGVFLWFRTTVTIYDLTEIAVYFFIQQNLFSHFFGKADCHAFCVCAVMEHALGFGAESFWKQMILAYAALIFHQIKRNNIVGAGKLRQAVPFLPYIAGAFFVNILQFPCRV